MIYIPQLWENNLRKHIITVCGKYTMLSNGRIIRGALSGNIEEVGVVSIIINGQENINKILIKPAGQLSRSSVWSPIELKEGDVLDFKPVRDIENSAVSVLIELDINI